MANFKVYMPQDAIPSAERYLEENGCQIIRGGMESETAMAERIADCDALFLRSAHIPDGVLRAAHRLKVVGRAGAGYNNINVPLCTELGIRVAYAPMGGEASVPEHTMYLLLACMKNASYIHKHFCGEGDFSCRNRLHARELQRKTIGIVGFGRIGRQVGAMAHDGFHMNVIAYDPFLKPEDVPDYVELLPMDEVFSRADAVSLHLPATPETVGIVNREKFLLMKPDAVLINAARGEVINEADLVEALSSGQIAAAGIDVFDPEPPAADHPLLHMENVVATPHYASITAEAMERLTMQGAEAIIAVLNGREPQWPLN